MTIQSETVELQVEDGRIAGTVVSPGSKMPAILFVHGWGAASSATWLEHGRSPGWAACA